MAKCPVGRSSSGVGAVQRRSRDRKIGFSACKRQRSTDTDSIRREPSDGNIDTIRRISTVEAILRTIPLRQTAEHRFGFSTLASKRRISSETLLYFAAGTIPANIRATTILPDRPTNPTCKRISPATENHNGLPEKLKAKNTGTAASGIADGNHRQCSTRRRCDCSSRYGQYRTDIKTLRRIPIEFSNIKRTRIQPETGHFNMDSTLPAGYRHTGHFRTRRPPQLDAAERQRQRTIRIRFSPAAKKSFRPESDTAFGGCHPAPRIATRPLENAVSRRICRRYAPRKFHRNTFIREAVRAFRDRAGKAVSRTSVFMYGENMKGGPTNSENGIRSALLIQRLYGTISSCSTTTVAAEPVRR